MALTKEFDAVPQLNSMFIKAALAKGTGKKSLPEMQRTLNNIDIDAQQLKDYNAVCGFSNRAVLPPTYLHMFAFPMFMDMFVDKQFPFKAMGLVHVSNQITQHRPVRCSEVVDMQCSLENLQEVDKGYEFDVKVEASVEGELVWSSIVRNIARTKKGSSSGGKKKQHEEMDWSDWNQQSYTAQADIGRRYAKVSGDYNPIHLYPLTAKLFGFPRTIAHGMWTKAKALALLESVYSAEDSFSVDVKFKLPNLLPSKNNLFSQQEGDALDFWVRTERDDKPIAEGQINLAKTSS